jgi:hypothetical protein
VSHVVDGVDMDLGDDEENVFQTDPRETLQCLRIFSLQNDSSVSFIVCSGETK